MSNNKRNDNSNSNYIYPQPYIDPMVYLNPYYSNATGYQNNSQGYVEYTNPNNGYIDYSQFNDNAANTYPDQNYINNNTYDSTGEYTNIPAEDFNIPSVPYFQQPNMANPQQNMPNMILPNPQYQSLPPNMSNQGQGMGNQNQQNMNMQDMNYQNPNYQDTSYQNQQNANMQDMNYQNPNMVNQGAMPYGMPMYPYPNMMGGYIPMPKPPMYPAGMFPNMYPEMMPNMMYPNYPFVNAGPGMPSVNMEEFDEEEM